MNESLVRAVELLPPDESERRVGYPWDLPAVQALSRGLDLDAHVTYLIGENGSGKSTLLEAIAVAAGMNAEGGSSNLRVLNPRLALRAVAFDPPDPRRASPAD